ncbi:hypothetical protein SAMN02910358_02082 [Lachnospiraceae bacterium XBB1006]|nr:hypothetical protein SAMN02910358_02082 [Lachnospiraceae bacterium XBB1006]
MSSSSSKGFFENYKYCRDCKTLLPDGYEFEYCPQCIEQRLFREVRDYIRKNNVNEYEVAEEFELPVRRVKAWIREGRIQYQEQSNKVTLGIHCARCGEPISIGTFCNNCMRFMKGPKGTIGFQVDDIEASRMRFLDESRKK